MFPDIKTYFGNNLRLKKAFVISCAFLFGAGLFFYILKEQMVANYRDLQSLVIIDRNGEIISVKQNSKGNYALYADALPKHLKNLLIEKEDKFFYSHFGVNPLSSLRALWIYLKTGVPGASSTLDQQLAKNLLGNESNRTIFNKMIESAYAFALELYLPKETIITMYGNTAYMGNQTQGFRGASKSYFDKNPADLNDTEILSLLATLSNPSSANPFKKANKETIKNLSARFNIPADPATLSIKKIRNATDTDFEFKSLADCIADCKTTLDAKLSDKLREILKRNIAETSGYGGRNGSIVVIKLPENELLTIIGTPDTASGLSGSAINMATRPRPIGSTIKPFIYLKGFEKGLRPYTNVDDREYKFSIATGFSLYPKNYDGLYRGEITLHEALSNSLNVPTVKTLEYITLSEFYSFLEQKLQFKPLKPWDSYQYGIALGGLEMTPLTLAHLITIFPNEGILKPLTLFQNKNGSSGAITPPMETSANEKNIADDKYVQLVNKIISDRIAGVEQFGLAGNLNLPQTNYAVKTGTSRDFHDTWTVGFTPDFLVTVWLGNVENEPMRQITSSSGAGKIWHDAMELLINSEYNKNTPFDFSKLSTYQINGKIEYGLPGDNVKSSQNLLAEKSLILKPHDGDVFSFEAGMEISLKSANLARWYENDNFIGDGQEISFHPSAPGTYTIRAESQNKNETITIKVIQN